MTFVLLKFCDRLVRRCLRLVVCAAAPDWVRDWNGPFTVAHFPDDERGAG